MRRKAVEERKGRSDIYEKYKAGERNRKRGSKNKLSAGLRRLFPNSVQVLEDLDKQGLVSRKWISRNRRKKNARILWRSIHRRIPLVTLQLLCP
jgi:hypothetical protein